MLDAICNLQLDVTHPQLTIRITNEIVPDELAVQKLSTTQRGEIQLLVDLAANLTVGNHVNASR